MGMGMSKVMQLQIQSFCKFFSWNPMWPANFNKSLVQMLCLEWCRATCGERWKDKHNMINVTLVLDLLICCGGGSNVGGGTDTNDCWNNAYSCWTYKINDMLGNNQENQVSPMMIFLLDHPLPSLVAPLTFLDLLPSTYSWETTSQQLAHTPTSGML